MGLWENLRNKVRGGGISFNPLKTLDSSDGGGSYKVALFDESASFDGGGFGGGSSGGSMGGGSSYVQAPEFQVPNQGQHVAPGTTVTPSSRTETRTESSSSTSTRSPGAR